MHLILKMRRIKFNDFFCGFPLEFKDWIEYDDPYSLQELIEKLKHFYENSKHKKESQEGWKWKDNGKAKWQPKGERPQNVEEEENIEPHKKFNAKILGHRSQQQNKGDRT